MKSFLEWLNLHESMSVYVSGHEYNHDVNDLDDLALQIKNRLINPAFSKLSPESKRLVEKGESHRHGIIVPDGDYYSNGKENLNFYTAGWGDMIPKLLQGVRYFLDEMGVKYGTFKTEKSGIYNSEVVRIPILQWSKTKNNPPLLNLANDNAMLIFGTLLGMPGGNDGFHDISPADLYRKVDSIDTDALDIHARDPYHVKPKNGAEQIHFGLSGQDIQQRLDQIKKIAKWALDNHYDKIDVV